MALDTGFDSSYHPAMPKTHRISIAYSEVEPLLKLIRSEPSLNALVTRLERALDRQQFEEYLAEAKRTREVPPELRRFMEDTARLAHSAEDD